MKKIFSKVMVLLIISMLIVFLPHTVNAADSDFQYSVANSTATITGYTGSDPNPVIPEVINGIPVVSIQSKAFFSKTALLSVFIPDSVKRIGSEAFSGCTSMTSVRLPEGGVSIESKAFNGCTGLRSLTINTKGTSKTTSIAINAFLSCTGLQTVAVTNESSCSIVIGETAFKSCTAMASLILNAGGPINIGKSSFDGCKSLLTLTFHANLLTLDETSFFGCTGLTDITVDTDSELFSSLSGVLYNKDMTQLLFYPEGKTNKSFTVPDNVTTIAEGSFRNCKNIESVILPDSISVISLHAFRDCVALKSINLPSSLASIGDYAFSNCICLTTVLIPNSVTSIGSYAFYMCSTLNNLTFDNCTTSMGAYAFYKCIALTKVTIPGSIISVGPFAFAYSTALLEVTFGDGVKTIGMNSFQSCTALTKIDLSEGITEIGNYAFSACKALTQVSIPSTVTKVGSSAFASCSLLASVTLNEGAASAVIGSSAFASCVKLTQLSIPGTYQSIGASAFLGCTGLTELNLAEGVSYIEKMAFQGCTSLTTMYLPSTVSSIGEDDSPFYLCSALSSISVSSNNITFTDIDGVLCDKAKQLLIFYPEGKQDSSYSVSNTVNAIGNDAFKKCLNLISVSIPEGVTSIEANAFELCSLTDVSIPETVSNIGDFAFLNCKYLQDVAFPSGVTNVGKSAFQGCIGMKTLIIKNGATTIGESSFAGCTGLTSVVIPQSVSNIGIKAFSGCNKLTSVSIQKGVSNISNYAFENCTGLKCVTIPDSVSEIGTLAFQKCSNLKFAFFFGASPSTTTDLFSGTASTFQIYYRPAAQGFTTPLWKGYLASPSGLADYIENVYQHCLGTGVEADVLADRVTNYLSNGLTGANIAEQMVNSAAFKIMNYSNETYVSIIYEAFLDRAATEQEIAAGKNLLDNGITRYYVLTSVVDTQEFKDKCAALAITPGSLALPMMTVSFNAQGGSAVANKLVEYYSVIAAAPTAPTRAGYSFIGWYKESACTNAWDFTTDRVTTDAILYAKWVPSTPTGLAAASTSVSSIKLSWTAVPGATGYTIYSSTSATSGFAYLKLATGASYTNTGLTTGTTYYYKIKAYIMVGTTKVYSEFTPVVNAIPIPAAPAGVTASSTSPTSIKVSWSAVTGATGYLVYRSTSESSGFTYIKAVTATSYNNKGLTTGTTYYYKIKAYTMVGTTKISSMLSSAVSSSPIAAPAAPTGLAVASAGPDSIQISWNPVAGVSGYTIYRSTSATSGFAYLKALTSTSYTNTGLTTGTTYYYKIKSYTLVGTTKAYSADTEVVSVAP